MAVVILERQRTVDALIADVVDFPDARMVLADLLADLDSGLDMRLRFASHVPLLWQACRWGTKHAMRAAAAGHATVVAWAERVQFSRNTQLFSGPEAAGNQFFAGPSVYTLRECEGSEAYRATVARRRDGYRWLYGKSHLMRLCLRALEGHDVPFDVQASSAVYAEICREHLRNLGSVNLKPLKE